MTVRLGFCALLMVAVIGIANAATPEKRDNTVKQTSTSTKVLPPAAGKQSTSATATAKPTSNEGAQSQKAPAKKKQVAAKPKSATVKKEQPKPESAEATEASDTTTKTSPVRRLRGQRDPFETVIRSQPEGPGCSTGKKCLVVDKMDLKGVVRSQNGMIAIVVTEQRKTYFLHENDPVYNGHVVKINPDAIVFRETVIDRVGRQSTRDVVKRIARPAA